MSTLLLNHFNGTDGATTFTDEIPGITWTRLLGDPPCELDTGKAKFGVSSLINSVSSSAYASGFSSPHAGSWTAETFALFTGSIGGGFGFSPSLVLRLDAGAGTYIAGLELYTDAYSQYWVFSLNSDPSTEFYYAQGSVSFAANTWHHLAIVRDSAAGTYAAYHNGVRLVSTSTSTNIYTVSRFVPAGSGDSAYHTFWFDESRLTNEVKYSGSTYTVPTAEFSREVIVGTLLLNHFNGTDGATTFTDEVPGITWSQVVGNAEIDTAQAKFGVSSVLFPGNLVQGKQIACSSFGVINAGNWTIEGFFRITGSSGSVAITLEDASLYQVGAIYMGSGTSPSIEMFAYHTNDLENSFYYSESGTVSAGAWHHVALVRNNTADTYEGFFDGVRLFTQSQSDNTKDIARVRLIGDYDATNQACWWDEVRLSNIAKYSGSTYTVPTAEFLYPDPDIALGSAAQSEAADSPSADGIAWPSFAGAGALALSGATEFAEVLLAGDGGISLSGIMAPALQGFSGEGVLSLSASGDMIRPDPKQFGARSVVVEAVAVAGYRRVVARPGGIEILAEPSR